MKRFALVLLTALTVAAPIAVAQPASAGGPNITAFSVTSAVRNQGGDIKLSGSVTCLVGVRIRGKINVGQPAVQPITNAAKGQFDPKDCTGAAQAWHAKVTTWQGSMSLGAAQYSITMRSDTIVCCNAQVNLYTGSTTIT